MPIPLYGFLQGDTVGLLILAEEADTLHTLARKLQDAASLRVAGMNKIQLLCGKHLSRFRHPDIH